MLVLQRKTAQEIELTTADGVILIRVLKVQKRGKNGDQGEVSLGIAAPKSVKILRGELTHKPDPKAS
ncbi:MAG TPA: carbon storage regulator [Gemmataceae bacterium]|jgi:sRNA-binding carbon storage regulator CsrA|nr:carbon storage regulator [Gemmataceae bacterium]